MKQDKNRRYKTVSNSLNIPDRRIKRSYSKGSGLPCGLMSLLFPGSSVKLQLFSSLLIWKQNNHHVIVCPLFCKQKEIPTVAQCRQPVRVTSRQGNTYFSLCFSLSFSHPPRLFSLVLFKNGHYQTLNSALPRVAAVLLTSAKFLNHYPRCEFGPLSLIKAPVCSQ